MSSSLLRQGHRIVTIKHVSPNIQWTQKISPLFRLYSNVGLKEEVSCNIFSFHYCISILFLCSEFFLFLNFLILIARMRSWK